MFFGWVGSGSSMHPSPCERAVTVHLIIRNQLLCRECRCRCRRRRRHSWVCHPAAAEREDWRNEGELEVVEVEEVISLTMSDSSQLLSLKIEARVLDIELTFDLGQLESLEGSTL